MNWQWQVYIVLAYIAGAYFLRSEAKPGDSTLTNDHLAGITLAFFLSPVWVWYPVGSNVIDKVFSIIGRWIRGQ